jgi:hypothetical protein
VAIIMNDRRQATAFGPRPQEESATMSKADTVMVQPTSTYFEGADRKSAESAPYEVPRAHGEELKSLGIATIVEGKGPVPAPEKAAQPAPVPAPTVVTPEAPTAAPAVAQAVLPGDEPAGAADLGPNDIEPFRASDDSIVEQPVRRGRGRPPKSRT